MFTRLKFELNNAKFKIKCAWQRLYRGYDDAAVWNLNQTFLEYVPKILTQMNKNRMGCPYGLTDKEWDNILNKMIECFNEANEETCSKTNKYEDDLDRMYEDFYKQYGIGGEKLLKPEDRTEDTVRAYLPSDPEVGNPEWQTISKNFHDEMIAINTYRHEKLQEGLKLFTQYFWDLWD